MKNDKNVLHAFVASSVYRGNRTVHNAVLVTDDDGGALVRLTSIMPISDGPSSRQAVKNSAFRASLMSMDAAAGIIRGTGRAEAEYVLHAGRDDHHAFGLAQAGTSSIDGARFVLPDADEPWWTEALADAQSMAKAVHRGHMAFIPGSISVISAAVSEDGDLDAAHAAMLLSTVYGAELGYVSASFRCDGMGPIHAVAYMARALAMASKVRTVALEGDDDMLAYFDAVLKPGNEAGDIPMKAVPLSGGAWFEKFEEMRSAANALSDGCRNAVA